MGHAQIRRSASWRWTICALVVVGALWAGFTPRASMFQQPKKVRLNKIIHLLEQGKPAMRMQDWLWIEGEHQPFDPKGFSVKVAEMLKDRDADGRPRVTPLVRVPMDGDEIEHNKWVVKQVLDIGFMGIVFPHVDTKEQAMAAVRAVRYPQQRTSKQPQPQGVRGYGPGTAATLWGLSVPEYIQRADVWPLNPNGEIFVMVMIESPLGAKNVREIAQVPGISAVLLIPSDLANALGLPPNETGKNYPEVTAVWQAGLKACQDFKVVCAVVDAVEKNLKQRLADGFRVVG